MGPFEESRATPLANRTSGGSYMSLLIYLIGFAFIIGGIAWALVVAGVSTTHIMIVTVILVGVAILTGVTRTRTRD
jgi:hypothetical protein